MTKPDGSPVTNAPQSLQDALRTLISMLEGLDSHTVMVGPLTAGELLSLTLSEVAALENWRLRGGW